MQIWVYNFLINQSNLAFFALMFLFLPTQFVNGSGITVSLAKWKLSLVSGHIIMPFFFSSFFLFGPICLLDNQINKLTVTVCLDFVHTVTLSLGIQHL